MHWCGSRTLQTCLGAGDAPCLINYLVNPTPSPLPDDGESFGVSLGAFLHSVFAPPSSDGPAFMEISTLRLVTLSPSRVKSILSRDAP